MKVEACRLKNLIDAAVLWLMCRALDEPGYQIKARRIRLWSYWVPIIIMSRFAESTLRGHRNVVGKY